MGKPPTSDRATPRYTGRPNILFTVARVLGRVWVLTTTGGRDKQMEVAW